MGLVSPHRGTGGQALPVDFKHPVPGPDPRYVVPSVLVGEHVSAVVQDHHGISDPPLTPVLDLVPIIILEHLSYNGAQVEYGVHFHPHKGFTGVGDGVQRVDVPGCHGIGVVARPRSGSDNQLVTQVHVARLSRVRYTVTVAVGQRGNRPDIEGHGPVAHGIRDGSTVQPGASANILEVGRYQVIDPH